MARQFQRIRELGFDYVDLTDNHNGGMLGVEYGFAESVSLDTHPLEIREMVEQNKLTVTSVCAHANLLDPTSPARYGTAEIIKAVKLAHFLNVRHVITTEGEPKTGFGRSLTRNQKLFSIAEKLHEPLRWAAELGIELLIEPHGPMTDSPEDMQGILEVLGYSGNVGINLDTGNVWLGGADPVEFVKQFGDRIRHVHWKDLGEEWETKRGELFGCGMSTIPIGDGAIDIKAVVHELKRIGFDGHTTLEVAGTDNLKLSAERLREWAG